MRLRRATNFDETAYPELMDVFRDIDMAIAAMVATDPGFQARSTTGRRGRKPGLVKAISVRRQAGGRVAA